MAIEATGLLGDSAHAPLVSPERAREPAPRDANDPSRAAPEPDRLEVSAFALKRSVVGRFRELSSEAFEHPGKKNRILNELRQRFRDALHTLRKSDLLEQKEVKTLRKAFRSVLGAVASTGAPAELSRETNVEQSRSVSLDIRTVEGDSVRIGLQREIRVDESLQLGSDGESGTSLQAQRTVAGQATLRFTVEGDLSEDERAAVEDLVARVDQLAVRFFDGDVQAALQHVRELGPPDDEIAAYSVDLAYSRTARVVTAYREVEALVDPTDLDLSAAQDLFDDLRALAESRRLELLFVDSRRLVLEFFRGAVEIDRPDADGSRLASPLSEVERVTA